MLTMKLKVSSAFPAQTRRVLSPLSETASNLLAVDSERKVGPFRRLNTLRNKAARGILLRISLR